MFDKVIIETLPIATKDYIGAKQWNDGRGLCVQVSQDEEVMHVALLGINEGVMRGNHYHKIAEEIFYVICGKVDLYLCDHDTKEEQTYIINEGDKVCIKPFCFHRFLALENTVLVEYSLTKFDRGDSYND